MASARDAGWGEGKKDWLHEPVFFAARKQQDGCDLVLAAAAAAAAGGGRQRCWITNLARQNLGCSGAIRAGYANVDCHAKEQALDTQASETAKK